MGTDNIMGRLNKLGKLLLLYLLPLLQDLVLFGQCYGLCAIASSAEYPQLAYYPTCTAPQPFLLCVFVCFLPHLSNSALYITPTLCHRRRRVVASQRQQRLPRRPQYVLALCVLARLAAAARGGLLRDHRAR
jgi:hypothetical protein